MLQIAEHSAGIKQPENLRIQRLFPFMDQMMNCEARDDSIKRSKRRQRSIHIVIHNSNESIGGKPFPHGVQHGRRKVDGDRFCIGMMLANQRQQPAVASPQIEDSPGLRRNKLQQGRLPFTAVRDLVGSLEIVVDMFTGSPKVHSAASSHAKSIGKRLNSFRMNKTERHHWGIHWVLLPVLLALFACMPALTAQDNQPQDAQPQAPSQQQPTKPIPPPEEPKEGPKEEPKGDVKITPRQAEELFHSVDEILAFDSRESGLPVKHQVKRKLTSRDEVVSYLTKHLNDEDTQRLRRSELVLKKFGLLPRDFNLETFLVALLREEVAGYYDPKTKTVNLLDWVPIEEQEPVMAHELTHALQDQDVNLQKWMKRGEKDLAEIKKDPTPADIENDEMDNAREAVLEGQAQAMMFQYAIAPTGHSIATSPALVDAMQDETLTGTPSTKVFNDAPIFLKESLTFPYSYGMDFVIKVLQKGGKKQAFAGILADPPHTTRQIMEPETYLSGEKIEPMPVPDFKRDFKDYQKFDIGAMGEFDVAVLIEQYASKKISKEMYPEWRGGYYYAAKSKAKPDGPLALLYVSRWSSPTAAAHFAGIYAHSLNQRYKNASEAGGRHEKGGDAPKNDDSAPASLEGRHVWSTEDGVVLIEQKGDEVLITESLDDATSATVEKEVLAAPVTAK